MIERPSCVVVGENFFADHYIDHVIGVAELMESELILISPAQVKILKEHFPETPYRLLSGDCRARGHQILREYEVRFNPWFWERKWSRVRYVENGKVIEKCIRSISTHHGVSDKGYVSPEFYNGMENEDICLLAGDRHKKLFKTLGLDQSLNSTPVVGNIRAQYYLKHKAFLDGQAEKHVFSRFEKRQPTIFYAPTWIDCEDNSSIQRGGLELLRNLPDNYNMVFKPHPILWQNRAVELYRLLSELKHKKNLVFIQDYYHIYSVLDRCDIYVGDHSSVGYDFLWTKRPMFFLNQAGRDPENDPGLYIYRCGTEVKLEDFPHFYEIMERELPGNEDRFAKVRKSVYEEAFTSVPIEEARKRIIEAYNEPPRKHAGVTMDLEKVPRKVQAGPQQRIGSRKD